MFRRKLSIVCTLIMLSSCATSGFVSSWKAPDATPLEARGAKVGAIVMMQDEASRHVAEDALAREINARGAQGIPGYTVSPDSNPSTEAEARAAFEHAGVVMANISKGRSTWAEGSCELERFIVAGDKIVVFVHARVRLKDHTDWIDGRFADVYTFRNGKAIQMRSFGERQEALEWAEAKASDAT